MRVAANGLAIEVEVDGPPDGEPLLLIMGLGMQLTAWPPAFVRGLAARGFRVVRADNRDAGLSQGFDHLGVPHLIAAAMRYWLRLPVPSVYSLADMAADHLGVLDALGIERAHVCGASMGGMIAQHIAAAHAGRVRSLALMMTSSGARHLPMPHARVQRALVRRPRRSAGPEAMHEHLLHLLNLIGSPAYRPDPALMRGWVAEAMARAFRPAGTARQLCAVAADGDRSAMLDRIVAPTLILHGREDPLVPVAAAHDLAHKISGARLEIFDGMGHDLPAPLLARMIDAITALARSTSQGGAGGRLSSTA